MQSVSHVFCTVPIVIGTGQPSVQDLLLCLLLTDQRLVALLRDDFMGRGIACVVDGFLSAINPLMSLCSEQFGDDCSCLN